MATHAFPVSSTPAREHDRIAASDSTLDRWALLYFAGTLVLNCLASMWVLLTI